MTIEISFPRGGHKPPANTKPQDFKRDHDLFGRKRKKTTKHIIKTNVYQENEYSSKAADIAIHHVEQLSGKTIQDGMILLGCVKEIQKVALEISLPGRLWGKVFINSISAPYTKLLHAAVDDDGTESYKQLNELFTLGQCVAVKVLNLNDEKFGITLSMMPALINANISHTSVKAGMTLWGSIQEIEDHGYVVDLGISNCRAFLKKENCDVNKEYAVGQLLWCAVTKTDISTAATVMLTAKNEKVGAMKIMDDISLDHLLPGMQVDFTISEILSNGVEGKFLNGYTGYIDVGQLNKSVYDEDEYKADKILQARILYMMPVTKIAYFTVKGLGPHKKGKIKPGVIMNCKVQGVTPFGIHIKLATIDSRGFVPLHRLRQDIPHSETRSDYSYLKRHYTKRSIHQCRVLNYDYFGQIYICTMERKLLNQNIIFNLDNVKAGQTVSADIIEVQPNGLLVKVQQINGFIKNEHICDTVVKNYNIVKSRLKVGQTVHARVWVINKEKHLLHLTMRPSLVNTEHILKDYQDAKENQQFLGVIRQITTNGLLVQFFGDVHGWVPKKRMKFEDTGTTKFLFKIGQLVKCTVVNCRNTKLTLSLQSSAEITADVEHEIKLGEHLDGLVSHITDEGIHITVKNSDISGFIPTLYLSKFPKLAPIITKMYHPGDEISDLVCVSKNDSLPTLSLRNSELNRDNIQDITTLKIGTILPCSVLTVDSFGINVEAPIDNYKKTVLVPKENISDNRDVSTSNIQINQLIYAKIFNVCKNFESIAASTKLSDVWDYDIQSSVQYFSEYMKEVLRIREHFKSLENPLASLNLGEVVSGVMIKVNDDNSCIVQLNNGVKAVVNPQHVKENLSANDKVEGVVLFWNFEDNTAEIALCPKLMTRINHVQNGNMNIPPGVSNKSNSHAEVILVRNDFILGVLRGAAGKRQLIFFPGRHHANDFKPYLNDYVIGDYINIQVSRIDNGIIIGLLKQLVRDMNYKWRKNLKHKSELSSEEQPSKKKIKLENSNEQGKNDKKNKKAVIKTDNSDEMKVNGAGKEDKKGKKNKNNVLNDAKIQNKNNNKEKKKKDAVTEEIIKGEKTNNVTNEEKCINTEVKEKEKQKKRKHDEDSNTTNNVLNDQKIQTKNKKEKKTQNAIAEEINNDKGINNVSNEEENIRTDVKGKKNIKENHKKRKLDEDNNTTNNVSNEENINTDVKGKKNKKEKKRKLDEETQVNESNQKPEKTKREQIIDAPVVLPGANNFWNISEVPETISDDSSDNEEQDEKELEKLQKKKKRTPAEKAETARLEEERIRKIELELANAETTPKSADQFDRLVLANPNNSMYWINYMAFHLEATEIEKARSIARKALNTIEFREEQEKLNVWFAFLNLENRYGTKESFASVLEEAVKMNDSLTVYLQALNILSESKKSTEFLDLLRIVSRKFKPEFKMWTAAAEACYNNDLKDEARNLMQRSLKSLDEKQHINILVQFAFMEARHNEPERAEALLEKVLASYPRRVDVWTSYVDLLIKGNRIHIARNVLERAVGQKLPARKMKTLFSKYIQFETKFGDEENVKKVRQLAANYVKTALN